jgi:hypothetical protein
MVPGIMKRTMKSLTRQPGRRVTAKRVPRRRVGAAMLDYVLVLAAVLPMLAMSYYYSMRIIRAVYEMTCTLVCWPFM